MAEVVDHYDASAPTYTEQYDESKIYTSAEYPANYFRLKKIKERVQELGIGSVYELGIGDGSPILAMAQLGLKVGGSDFSKGMLEVGKKKYPKLEFVFADAMKLPFKDQEFDVVTMSFGLRNVRDHKVALGEFLRVLKPGGRLVICEFSHVPGPLGVLYRFYLKYFLPKISALFSKSPEAYDYLADSIQAWPKQKDLAQDIANVGFSQVGYKNLSFGIVALHQAVKR
jgi:demethylmenaquinone methyltransferase/2-methoxy-6-polyprenyl-1,4-benzoquinol methylase